MIVDRLLAARPSLRNSDERILIVGAGAAGVTAAMHAASQNVLCTLVEKESEPFGLQDGCATRWIDPTEYDWPLDHWPHSTYPWESPTMPLQWPANWAKNLAQSWRQQFSHQFSGPPPFLDCQWNTELTDIFPTASSGPAGSLSFTVTLSSSTDRLTVRAIIWAAGTGEEDCRLFRRNPNGSKSKDGAGDPFLVYEGRKFWSTDPYLQLNCGKGNPQQIVIAGAGDGGLQDYLRVVLRRYWVKQIYQAIAVPITIERDLQSAEDRARRALLWNDGNQKQFEHGPQRELQKAHQNAVRQALQEPAVVANLRRLIRVQPGTGRPVDVRLVYRCEHFRAYYAMNRFLTLLCAQFLADEFGMETLMPGCSICGCDIRRWAHMQGA